MINPKTNDFLPAALMISAALHAGVWGISKVLPSPAQFPVQQAPNTMDVHLIEEVVRPPIEEEPLAAEEPLKQENVKVEESLQSLGAVSEATPLEFVNLAPEYPALARRRGWEGIVIVQVRVEADGSPSSVVVGQSSGYRVLDEAALAAIRLWRFKPAQSGQMAFSSTISIPVRFELTPHE